MNRSTVLVIGLLFWNLLSATLAAQQPPTNQLADESSPYLLQHAHNPVDWYPWGEKALQKAQREQKLIFLSIGYAACHWCHVMERESFEDDEIAAELNERYVCIKVDREERPDVDQIYMTAVQLINGQGGWPLSVFLTPDSKPFWGGTYFPARDGDRGNATGFLTILTRIDQLWDENPQRVRTQAETVTEAIRRNQPLSDNGEESDSAESLPGAAEVNAVARELAEQFDPEFGGFGYSAVNQNQPKFPEPSNLLFLIARARDESLNEKSRGQAKQMLTQTLDGMLSGAMYDHIGGGFHRYSVDRGWQIPHFEKMLYDNAQLATVYAEAAVLLDRLEYRDVAKHTCDFVLRELQAPGGAFYSSLDADSEGEEGNFYRWSQTDRASLDDLSIAETPLAKQVYGFSEEPNFEKQYWLPAPGEPLTGLARQRDLTYRELVDRLAPLREAMFKIRSKRVRPATDVKVLTAWNGLTIAALADVGRILEQERYIDAAEEAAEFVLRELRTDAGMLLRSYARGQGRLPGYLDDYAFLIRGLLALHQTTGDEKWLTEARGLFDRQTDRFWDTQSGGFFFSASDQPTLIVRLKDPIDGAIPSGTSVSLENLRLLSALTADTDYDQRYLACLRSLKPLFDQFPAGLTRAAATLINNPRD